jgi:hypothetical protein
MKRILLLGVPLFSLFTMILLMTIFPQLQIGDIEVTNADREWTAELAQWATSSTPDEFKQKLAARWTPIIGLATLRV